MLFRSPSILSPETEGYIFECWVDGTETYYYGPGESIEGVSDNMTLHAVWTKTYKVTFDGNGHTGRNVPEPITVRSGGSLTLDETIPVPERDSYIFEGWSYNDTLYNTWDTIENITSDIILMASWRAVPVKFSITFDGKEATGGTVPSTVNVDEGTSYTITSEIPEKTGYTFKGWSDGQNTYTVGETLTNISSDITLSAVWEEIPKIYYNISFDGQGATGGVPEGGSVEEGNPYPIPENVPEKSGYTFKGWSDGQNTYGAGETLTNISADITLSAVWEEIPKIYYNISFDGDRKSVV